MSKTLAAYDAQILHGMKTYRRNREPRDVRLERLDPEQCRAVGPDDVECTLLYGHRGPCSWRRKKRP